MSKVEFQLEPFFQALDRERLARDLNWKQVAEQSGVSASTLSRMSQGKRPDVDSLSLLLNWSGLGADNFIGGNRKLSSSRAEPLHQITSVLHSDRNLSDDGRETMIDMITAAYMRLTKHSK